MTDQPSLSFQGALERAYRRACRAGTPEIGTDLVFCYAVRYVPSAWKILAPWSSQWRPVLRGKTGLTDPRPPDRTRQDVAFDDEVAFEAAATLRYAAFAGSDRIRARSRHRGLLPSMPVFSAAVHYAVYEAIHCASRWGVAHAAPPHLLLGVLAAPDGAAARLLARWSVTDHTLLADAVAADPAHRAGGAPSEWAVGGLTIARVLPAVVPKLVEWPWQALAWLVEARLQRFYRRHGARYGHPMLFLIDGDATHKAARAGHAFVTATDVLLSVADLHEQLAAAGKPLPEDVARWNKAGLILATHGVKRRVAERVAARLESVSSDAEDNLTGLPTRGWPRPRASVGTPVQGRTALTALREASLSAHRLNHPYAGTTHLLEALLADPHGPTARLLHRLGVDPDAIRSEAARHLDNSGSR